MALLCRTPLIAGVAQNAVNLSLDLLLVLGLGVGVVRALLNFLAHVFVHPHYTLCHM